MTRGTKPISVKIATTKVIEALKQSLNKLELDYTSQESYQTKYDKAMDKWKKEILKFAIDNFSSAQNVRTNYRSWNDTLNIDFDLIGKGIPAEPIKEYEVISVREYRETKEEISNAIRILSMTDEEYINTSTYTAISKYL
jgi:hypothetical protein